MKAECIYAAFDNKTSASYLPGPVEDFDTENVPLNSLTTPGGLWVFQYPGHEGGPEKKEIKTEPQKNGEPRKKAMSAEQKAKIKAGRQKWAAEQATKRQKLAEA